MGSAPFDDEGVATRDRELVADGVLTGYILSSYSARKLGTTTGNAKVLTNLIVAPTLTGGMDALLARLGTGLMITRAHGPGHQHGDGRLFAGSRGVLGSRTAPFSIRWRRSPSPEICATC